MVKVRKMTEEFKETKEEIIRYINFLIYNHDKKRFMSNKEIAKFIYNYGKYTEEEAKIKLDAHDMVEAFKEMFDRGEFCEFEMINKPIIIFGITEDIYEINRIKELKRETRHFKFMKKQEELKGGLK
jgi:hypothetical protein